MDAEERHQVVVGVDGSHPARNALRWASRLARLLDDDVTAVHGVGLLDHLGDGLVLSHPQIESLREVVEREWCGPLTHAGLAHRVEVVERPAVDALLAAAAERPTDLVVVGTRGLGLATDKALGSTALQLLRRVDVPVLVVSEPDNGPSVEVRRMTVGFDGSEDSRAALAWATDLADRVSATCEVAIAAEDAPVFPLGPSSTTTSSAQEATPARLRAVAEDACRPLRRRGIPYRVVVVRGDAADTVVKLAAASRADLVVVGASGEGSDADPLAGSVSRLVARQAGRPVVVVPGEAARRARAYRAPAGMLA
jgi:nucleotide-binding universal stress UspA family protein